MILPEGGLEVAFWGGAEERVRPGVEKASGLDSEPQRLPILVVVEVVRGGERAEGRKEGWMRMSEGRWRGGGGKRRLRVPGFVCGLGVCAWMDEGN